MNAPAPKILLLLASLALTGFALGCQAELDFYDIDFGGADTKTTDTTVQTDVETDTGPVVTCGGACGAAQTCCADPVVPTGVCLANASLQTDNANCGACGVACLGESSCVAGECACPVAGESPCGEECFDLQTDANNCGGCGIACDTTELCTWGQCIPDCSQLEPVAKSTTCGADETCDAYTGAYEPGDTGVTLSWEVGNGKTIPEGTYKDIQIKVQICHGGWNNPTLKQEHGLVWVSVGGVEPNPDQTIVDIWAEPCTDGSCDGLVTATTKWGPDPTTRTAPATTSVIPGNLYFADTTFTSNVVKVAFQLDNGIASGTLDLATAKGPIQLAPGQKVFATFGYRGPTGTRPALTNWRFYNASIRLVPYVP